MEIRTIKERLTMQEVLNHYNLKPSKNNMLCCPFHDDKTPSMQFYPETDTVYCFSGNCRSHGKKIDVIDFIALKENSSRHLAIKKAASLIPATAKSMTKYELLHAFYKHYTKGVLQGSTGVKYLESRNMRQLIGELGSPAYQPKTATFYKSLSKQELKLAEELGLIKPSARKEYHYFAGQSLVFEMVNKQGKTTGLYFRSVLEKSEAKHFYLKNSKGLYPYYPKDYTKRILLTESIIDAYSLQAAKEILSQQGMQPLALYGTNGLKKEHLELLQELPNLEEVALLMDGDAAGRTTTEKYGKQLHELLPKMRITAIQTPDNEDVNSLLQAYPDNFGKLLNELIENRELLFESSRNDGNDTKDQSVDQSSEEEARKGSTADLSYKQLDTSNPELIKYHGTHFNALILGGIAMKGLDRLKVTLKVGLLRHGLDLYHVSQTEQLISKLSDKLDIKNHEVATEIECLTTALEDYRLNYYEKSQAKNQQVVKELTHKERVEALDFLSSEDLMQNTMDALGATGIVGEEFNRLLMYIAMTSRKQCKPINVISLGQSGIGKSHLQQGVAACIPDEDKKAVTTLSPQALYYFKPDELKHQLILIEDLDGAEEVLYPLRELQSNGKLSKTVPVKDAKGNMQTQTLEVYGPVSVAGCTTRERIYEDNANRSFLIYIDDSKEQDKRIIEYQQRIFAGQVNKDRERQTRTLLQNCQRLLKTVTVRNPYAAQISIPEHVFKPRRSNAHYLAFIEAITFYCQYARERKKANNGTDYIETTLEDIRWANKLLANVLLRKSDELSGACRNFFEQLKGLVAEGETFKTYQIREQMRISPNNLKYYLRCLRNYSLVKIASGGKHQGFEYQITNYSEYNTLRNNIQTALDKALETIEVPEQMSVGG